MNSHFCPKYPQLYAFLSDFVSLFLFFFFLKLGLIQVLYIALLSYIYLKYILILIFK